jgi:hypothetical protein
LKFITSLFVFGVSGIGTYIGGSSIIGVCTFYLGVGTSSYDNGIFSIVEGISSYGDATSSIGVGTYSYGDGTFSSGVGTSSFGEGSGSLNKNFIGSSFLVVFTIFYTSITNLINFS